MADSPPISRDLTERRRFAAIQATKAAVGAGLAGLFLWFVGRPDPGEALAMAGLLAPGLFAALAFTRISLAALETASLATFAALIGYLVALTGGMSSPLLVWLALVPAEAALAGGRKAVWRAGGAASAALVAVAICQMLGLLPP